MNETVVGILPNEVIYGQQVATEDTDAGVIIWDQGTILPFHEYFPIVPLEVFYEFKQAA